MVEIKQLYCRGNYSLCLCIRVVKKSKKHFTKNQQKLIKLYKPVKSAYFIIQFLYYPKKFKGIN